MNKKTTITPLRVANLLAGGVAVWFGELDEPHTEG